MTVRRREPKKHQFGKAQGIREAVEMNTLGFVIRFIVCWELHKPLTRSPLKNCFAAAAAAGTLKGGNKPASVCCSPTYSFRCLNSQNIKVLIFLSCLLVCPNSVSTCLFFFPLFFVSLFSALSSFPSVSFRCLYLCV